MTKKTGKELSVTPEKFVPNCGEGFTFDPAKNSGCMRECKMDFPEDFKRCLEHFEKLAVKTKQVQDKGSRFWVFFDKPNIYLSALNIADSLGCSPELVEDWLEKQAKCGALLKKNCFYAHPASDMSHIIDDKTPEGILAYRPGQNIN